jgi:hypothetical protein
MSLPPPLPLQLPRLQRYATAADATADATASG